MPAPARRAPALMRIMGAAIADASRYGEVRVASIDTQIAGAVVWYPPGSYPRGPRRDTAQLLRLIPSALAVGTRIPAMLRLLARIDSSHPPFEHAYLEVLGVDPTAQGQGLGRALLDPLLERSDRVGLGVHLETAKHDNLAWYERAGFATVDQLSVRGCPPVWTMARPATAPRTSRAIMDTA